MPLKKDKPSSFKLYLGLFILFVSFLVLFGDSIKKSVVSKSFSQEPVEVQGFKEREVEENPPTRVVIPDVGIDLPVKKALIVDGYWEVFGDMAGWGEGTSSPGQAGNQVIFAHARRGLFLPLKNIKAGVKIEVYSGENKYLYEVKEIKEVLPSQIEVIEPTEDETLTLYTCSGYSDAKRLIVVAKRV
jgi:LPXTG-site transpeptidase (sortase) family protein